MRAKIEIEQDIQHINQELDILLSLEGEERNPEGSVSQEIGRLKNQLERLEVEMQHANRGIIFNPEEEDMLDAEIEADLEAEMYANDIETTKVHFYRDGGEVFSTSSQFSVSKEEVIDLANSVTAFDRSERGADEINDIDGALSILRTKYPEYAELDSSDFYDDEEMDQKFDDYALSSYEKGGKITSETILDRYSSELEKSLKDWDKDAVRNEYIYMYDGRRDEEEKEENAKTMSKDDMIYEIVESKREEREDYDLDEWKEYFDLNEAVWEKGGGSWETHWVKKEFPTPESFGFGGMLAGFVVGGYAGYKYGLTKRKRDVKDLFSEEKKFAKDYKKRMKKQKEERKKRGEREYTDYEELKKGGCVDSYANGGKLNSVRVKFKNSKYDYSTSIGANVSEAQARKYFVGMPVNVASYPREKFEEVIDIDYTKGGNYKKGGRMMKEEENPCWKGYQMYGMKKKDGKEVPNCVPEDKKEKGGTTEHPWGTFENTIEASGTYWDSQISDNNDKLRRIAETESKSFDEIRADKYGFNKNLSDEDIYRQLEGLRRMKGSIEADNLHLYDNFGGEKEYLKWKKEQKESQELPFEKGGKLLKQDFLSSSEYQKAKKLKDFKKEDYKWSSDKDLYVRKDDLRKPISIKRGRDRSSGLRRMYGFEKGGWIDFKSKREINKIKKELEKKGDTYSIKFDPDGSRFGLKGGGRYRITSGEYLSTTYAKGGEIRSEDILDKYTSELKKSLKDWEKDDVRNEYIYMRDERKSEEEKEKEAKTMSKEDMIYEIVETKSEQKEDYDLDDWKEYFNAVEDVWETHWVKKEYPELVNYAKGGALMTRIEAEQEIKKLKKKIKSLKKKEGDFAHRGAWNNFRAEKIRPLEERVIEISDDINTGNLKYAKGGVIGVKTLPSFKPADLENALKKAKIEGYSMNRLSTTLIVLKVDGKDINDTKKIIDDLGLSVMMKKGGEIDMKEEKIKEIEELKAFLKTATDKEDIEQAKLAIEELENEIMYNYEKGGKIEEMDWDEIVNHLNGLDDVKKATGSLSPKQIMWGDELEKEYEYREEKGYKDYTYEEMKDEENERTDFDDYAKGGMTQGGLLRVLKDSGFNHHKGSPKNELKHNRGQYIATIGKDNIGEVVHLDKYTPNTKRFISSTSFDNPKKLADYLNKNQIYAKGGEISEAKLKKMLKDDDVSWSSDKEFFEIAKNRGFDFDDEKETFVSMKTYNEGVYSDKDFAKGGVIKKGDYVRDARGELGLVNKVSKGVAYVKYPSTNQNAFEPVFLHEIKETKDMYRGRKVYTDFYDK